MKVLNSIKNSILYKLRGEMSTDKLKKDWIESWKEF